jgi:hypothetical protein
MAQTGYTPILIYASGTASNVPTAANLTSSAAGAELALNYADGRLFYKDSSGVVRVLAAVNTAPVTQTANFSVGATDRWIINNKSGSSCTATLPTASTNAGRVLYFQNYQAQTLVSASSNVVQIGGGAAATSILLASAGDQATLVSDGTNWIMMQYVPNNILLLE